MLRNAKDLLLVGAMLVCLSAIGCSGPRACTGGMCPVSGAKLSEAEVRQRASTFAYKRLVERQKTRAPITGPDYKPVSVKPINPTSWQVTKTNTQWRLERHVTQDFWQVVECQLNGSQALVFYKIAPPPPEGRSANN